MRTRVNWLVVCVSRLLMIGGQLWYARGDWPIICILRWLVLGQLCEALVDWSVVCMSRLLMLDELAQVDQPSISLSRLLMIGHHTAGLLRLCVQCACLYEKHEFVPGLNILMRRMCLLQSLSHLHITFFFLFSFSPEFYILLKYLKVPTVYACVNVEN